MLLKLNHKSLTPLTKKSSLESTPLSTSQVVDITWKRQIIPMLLKMRMEILPGNHLTTSIKSLKNVHTLDPKGLFSEFCLK